MNFFTSIIDFVLDLIKKIFGGGEKYEREFFCGAFIYGHKDITLKFLAKHLTDDDRQKMLDDQKNYGCNVFKFNTLNSDPNCYCTPYKNGFGGEFNEDWIKMTETWTKKLISAKLEPIPALTMDNGPDSWTNPKHWNEHVRMIQKLSETFKNLWKWILIGHEVSEYWGASFANQFAGKCKEFFPNSNIGIQSQEYNILRASPNLSWLAYEFSWHPKDGNSHSAEELWDISKNVINACGGKMVFLDEYNTDCAGSKARSQGLACSGHDTNRCIGVDCGFPGGNEFVKFMRNLPKGMTSTRSGSLVTLTGCGKTAQLDLKNQTYKMI